MRRHDQEATLKSKMVVCPSIFVEFDQAERPMSMPPTLLNGGNAIQHSATEVADVKNMNDSEPYVAHKTKVSDDVVKLPAGVVLPSHLCEVYLRGACSQSEYDSDCCNLRDPIVEEHAPWGCVQNSRIRIGIRHESASHIEAWLGPPLEHRVVSRNAC